MSIPAQRPDTRLRPQLLQDSYESLKVSAYVGFDLRNLQPSESCEFHAVFAKPPNTLAHRTVMIESSAWHYDCSMNEPNLFVAALASSIN